MKKFDEAQLEKKAIIQLLEQQGYPYVPGAEVTRDAADEVLIKE